MRSHFTPTSIGKTPIRSHFIRGAAIACAVTGATAWMPNIGAAQIALDQASNPIYAGGWAAGQNGGYGFGAWSFDSTVDPSGNLDPGAQQTMSGASPIGTAWTLFNLGSAPAGSGVSNVGRAITEPGGLQPGQTFETVINNPTAYHYYGGFDILFYNGLDNNPPGINTSALRTLVFNYFVTDWKVVDNSGATTSPLTAANTGAAGMKFDLTLTSATTYSLTLTALNGSGAYTHAGTLANSLPINYVNFRLWNGQSSGPNDVANNFGISYLEIVPEPATFALVGLGFGGLLFFRRCK